MRAFLLNLFLPFLFSTLTQAAELTRWQQKPDGTLAFWVLHSEEGVSYVEQFEQARGRLQVRTHSHAYPSREKALQAFRKISSGYKSRLPISAFCFGSFLSKPTVLPRYPRNTKAAALMLTASRAVLASISVG
jgi:hypothetical protein